MSSRSGPNANRHRTREAQEEFPPLPPVPRLPSLRNLANLQQDRDREASRHRDRDGDMDRVRIPADDLFWNSAMTSTGRPPTRNWSSAAARRVERIRNLEDQVSSLDAGLGGDRLSELSRMAPNTALLERRRRNSNAFHILDRSLGEANSQLRTLLDLTNLSADANQAATPSLTPPVYPAPARPHDFSDDSRRSKRRKIEPDKPGLASKGFRYGKFGQVEPGQLLMEIVSCDGGMFSGESSYAADNILKNDFSVYCTKGNRCNIVLRHQGGTVFTLQELVIKAPGPMNYSHPVREGMVFVAMKQDEVLSRTAQYQIQYPSKPPSESSWHEPIDVDVHSFRIDSRPAVSIRHHDDGTTSTRPRRSYLYRPDEAEDGAEDEDGDGDGDTEIRPAHMPHEFSSNVPDFQVTTECSDEEGEGGYGPARTFRRTPNRIGSLPFEAADSDDDERTPLGQEVFGEGSSRRNRERTTEAPVGGAQDDGRAAGRPLLSPHARFFIEEKKSKCTIRFEPAVSGRFILLKMWSSQHDPNSNIDIQTVIARGFAGPRYFPSIELG